ncbi:sensor histidine kinase [Mesobacillus harenae]|uniref:sensor histidine kinase n=1 Tax=Mesobacillus harenae TaxID=2213203 RepID=UPI00158090AC|nr:histidine kinase [Mesobacillus harenae]
MISYESFFIVILISILGPVVGFFILIFYTSNERQVYFLEMENRQALLEKELEVSRYLQLNQQIQPHFLFNALNSLLGLVRLKQYDRLSGAFEHMVMYLRSKYTNKEALYPMEKEISYTNNYLEIQKLRFGHRLQIDWEIEKGLNQTLVIPYLLQTLVENAFKHGLEMIEEDAALSIKISQLDSQTIQLTVEDNGPGFKEDYMELASEENKIGLLNLQRRLFLLFQQEATFTTKNRSHNGGAVVEVTWPLRTDLT